MIFKGKNEKVVSARNEACVYIHKEHLLACQWQKFSFPSDQIKS